MAYVALLFFFIKVLLKPWQILATLKESVVTISIGLHVEAGEDRAPKKCKTTAKTLNKRSLAAEKGDDTRGWGMASKNCHSEEYTYYESSHGSSGFEELIEKKN